MQAKKRGRGVEKPIASADNRLIDTTQTGQEGAVIIIRSQ
jgi:hypothetical protein